MGALYGGSNNMTDNISLRVAAIEKHIMQQTEGSTSTRAIRTAMTAALISALTSGAITATVMVLLHH